MLFTDWQDSRPRLASSLGISAIALAACCLAYFRLPYISARTVWAEDGALFLQEYLEQGPGLLDPYAGYLHFLPRVLVAAVASVFGLEAYPVAIAAVCSIVAGLVAALTFYCASALTGNLAARLCWASIPILAAPAALEVMGNVANLHWYMLWLTPWVLMKAPSALGQKMLLGISALIIGLSEIQSVIFIPLVFLRLRVRSLWWAKAGLLIGVACQVFTLWMYPRYEGGTAVDGVSVFYGYFLNTSAAIFFGSSDAIINHIQGFGAAPIVLSAVPFAGVAFLLARLGTPGQRLTGCIFLLASVTIWVAAMVVNPAASFGYSRFGPPGDWGAFLLSRYSAVPTMFLLALIPLLISRSAEHPDPSGPLAARVQDPWFRGVLVGSFLILQTVYYFPIGDARSEGPVWAPQIQAAQMECRANSAMESVEIHQSPGDWVTKIRCVDLLP